MKKIVALSILTGLLSSFCFLESIYSISFRSIDGRDIRLADYRNKKMLFVIVPLSLQDTTMPLTALFSLQKKYDTSLVVIGIPSEETGFKKGGEKQLKNLFKDYKRNFILAEGMSVKKSSGAKQNALMQWLTHQEKNGHFDYEAKGIGQKFFVDEVGELYAVMGPEVKLTHPIIDKILSKPRKN